MNKIKYYYTQIIYHKNNKIEKKEKCDIRTIDTHGSLLYKYFVADVQKWNNQNSNNNDSCKYEYFITTNQMFKNLDSQNKL